ncbi:2-dehydro-3-deoxygalactonokinase [Dongia sp.]|uniref:2-dehydro-3-deoxygalactonokinase n=1 Tax=Dongia sp. TaxID=1977262 RepID=UPI0035B4F630
MLASIACIAIDWGTSNRRAWALATSGAVLAARGDDQGLLAIEDRDFAGSLRRFAGDWLKGRPPVIMCGMIGSRLGWRDVPYLEAPVPLREIGRHLLAVDGFDDAPLRIVPGIALRAEAHADVMRGEECQMLGALLARGRRDGIFLLPGTHAKWAILKDGVLIYFRTYMTGELFGLLRSSGSLSQVMPAKGEAEQFDAGAFDRGLGKGLDGAGITHLLFSVRSLSLFGQLTPAEAPSYLSGLLIGAEMKDALGWLKVLQAGTHVTAIGSVRLLQTYGRAAARCNIELSRLESDDILPPALFAIARGAGLIAEPAA